MRSVEKFELMFENEPIAEFNVKTGEVTPITWLMAPYSLVDRAPTFGNIRSWISSRVLLMNRKYFKEILMQSGIDGQSDIDICIASRALSFADCYWVRGLYSGDKWEDVNLFDNEFSAEISVAALTGKMSDKSVKLDEQTFSGELSGKGTKAKRFIKNSTGVYVAKHETNTEIAIEEASYYINQMFGVESAYYKSLGVNGLQCSVCKLPTNKKTHAVYCRDVMDAEDVVSPAEVFHIFENYGGDDFLTMCIADYICLNTDRNRDNYGFKTYGNRIKGMLPMFDHDSYFKGKGDRAIYFPTGKTFGETADMLREKIKERPVLRERIKAFREHINSKNEVIDNIIALIGKSNFENMVERANAF